MILLRFLAATIFNIAISAMLILVLSGCAVLQSPLVTDDVEIYEMPTLIGAECECENTWKTKDGEVLRAEDMGTSHIKNCLTVLDKKHKQQVSVTGYDYRFKPLINMFETELQRSVTVKKEQLIDLLSDYGQLECDTKKAAALDQFNGVFYKELEKRVKQNE